MGRLRINTQLFVTLFIIAVFGTSIFVVFSTSGTESTSARMIINFGQPGMVYDNNVPIGSDTTALKMISMNVNEIKVANGEINCINQYCNTEQGHWKFYKVIEGPLGLSEEVPEQGVEDYIVSEGDIILFRYEYNSTKIIEMNDTENGTISS